MEDAPTTVPKILDSRTAGVLSLPPRAIDPGFTPHIMYALNVAHPRHVDLSWRRVPLEPL